MHGSVLASGLVVGSIVSLSAQGRLIEDPDDQQAIINAACDVIAKTRRPGDRVFTTHPYVPFRVGLDGFDGEQSRMLWGFHDEVDEGPSRPGDIIFWDAALGPNECAVDLATLRDNPALTVLGVFAPKRGHFVFGGRPYETWVFQRYPAKRNTVRDTVFVQGGQGALLPRLDTVPCEGRSGWCSQREYPLTIERVPSPARGVLYEDWLVETDIHYFTEGNQATFVFKRSRGDELFRYDDRPLDEGPNRFSFRFPADSLQVEQSFYIYSPGARGIGCTSLRIVRERIWQERLH